MDLKTDEKADFGKVDFFNMTQGKIGPQNPKKLTEKLTKRHLIATRSEKEIHKAGCPARRQPSKNQQYNKKITLRVYIGR